MEYRVLRVLVTGGLGFIGSEVARLCHKHGDDVHVIIRPGTADERLDALPAGVMAHRVDLTDLEDVTSVVTSHRPVAVVHAASSPAHPATPEERIAAWRDDVIATVTLLEALRRQPPQRLVHIGSSLVYRPSPEPLHESSPLAPETLRGVVKLAAEAAVRQWAAETGVPSVVIRPFSVYGPGADQGRVIPVLLLALRTRMPFAMVSDESRRDFVHITDLARCVTQVMSSPVADGRVLNVGTGIETSIKELVAVAERVTGTAAVTAPNSHRGTPPQRPHWCADPSLAEELLGWTAEVSLKEGLGMLWDMDR